MAVIVGLFGEGVRITHGMVEFGGSAFTALTQVWYGRRFGKGWALSGISGVAWSVKTKLIYLGLDIEC